MTCVHVRDVPLGSSCPLVLISGPCVVESETIMRQTARVLVEICGELALPLIFKSSYEKDNRTDGEAYRGPGLARGLEQLSALQGEFHFPLTSDVHRVTDVSAAARTLDLLQVPALLCRQTSLLEALAKTGHPVNLKKGQFMSPQSMGGAVEKVRAAGGQALLTERGTSFGYDRLVCDLANLPLLAAHSCPVVLDAGHAANRREEIPLLARCGVVAGADALFIECHPDPEKAKCDGPRMLSLVEMDRLLRHLAPLAHLERERRGA
jgi:2-dehydro-3-deoxyphosphooctonate aldolase (KDO 8-P synthase)